MGEEDHPPSEQPPWHLAFSICPASISPSPSWCSNTPWHLPGGKHKASVLFVSALVTLRGTNNSPIVLPAVLHCTMIWKIKLLPIHHKDLRSKHQVLHSEATCREWAAALQGRWWHLAGSRTFSPWPSSSLCPCPAPEHPRAMPNSPVRKGLKLYPLAAAPSKRWKN